MVNPDEERLAVIERLRRLLSEKYGAWVPDYQEPPGRELIYIDNEVDLNDVVDAVLGNER